MLRRTDIWRGCRTGAEPMFAAWFSAFFIFFLSFSFFSKCSNAYRQTSTLYSIWLTFVFLGERYRSRPRLRDEPAFYFTFVSLTRGLLSVPPSSSGMTPRGIFIAMTTLFASCGTKDLLGSRVGDRWAVPFSWRTRLDPVRSDPYWGYRSDRTYGSVLIFLFRKRADNAYVRLSSNWQRTRRESYRRFSTGYFAIAIVGFDVVDFDRRYTTSCV